MWSGPFADFLGFIRVGGDSIGRDNVPQEGDLGFRELTLIGVEGKASAVKLFRMSE